MRIHSEVELKCVNGWVDSDSLSTCAVLADYRVNCNVTAIEFENTHTGPETGFEDAGCSYQHVTGIFRCEA